MNIFCGCVKSRFALHLLMYIHLAQGSRNTPHNVAVHWGFSFESQLYNLLSLAGFIPSDAIARMKRGSTAESSILVSALHSCIIAKCFTFSSTLQTADIAEL